MNVYVDSIRLDEFPAFPLYRLETNPKWRKHMKFLTGCLSILLFLGPAFALGQSSPSSSDHVEPTRSVWQHHIEAWNSRDLDAIAADYDQTSVMIINGRVCRGQSEIKAVFKKLFEIFDRGSNQIDTPVLQDRIVFITWHFTPWGGTLFDGTDTFVIEDGVIRIQTIASRLY